MPLLKAYEADARRPCATTFIRASLTSTRNIPTSFAPTFSSTSLSDFVRARKEGKGTELPAFVLLYLPDDHTHGTTPGKPRPAASVADNDLAVGRVVEAVSHSPYWDDTAIFIIEDDAQDGADHVDAHRSTAFEISKYSPGSPQQPFVDSRFYTTVNMMHTMETLLGLPPMNQNDAYAPVMAPLFSGPGISRRSQRTGAIGTTGLSIRPTRPRARARRNRPGWTSRVRMRSTLRCST